MKIVSTPRSTGICIPEADLAGETADFSGKKGDFSGETLCVASPCPASASILPAKVRAACPYCREEGIEQMEVRVITKWRRFKRLVTHCSYLKWSDPQSTFNSGAFCLQGAKEGVTNEDGDKQSK